MNRFTGFLMGLLFATLAFTAPVLAAPEDASTGSWYRHPGNVGPGCSVSRAGGVCYWTSAGTVDETTPILRVTSPGGVSFSVNDPLVSGTIANFTATEWQFITAATALGGLDHTLSTALLDGTSTYETLPGTYWTYIQTTNVNPVTIMAVGLGGSTTTIAGTGDVDVFLGGSVGVSDVDNPNDYFGAGSPLGCGVLSACMYQSTTTGWWSNIEGGATPKWSAMNEKVISGGYLPMRLSVAAGTAIGATHLTTSCLYVTDRFHNAEVFTCGWGGGAYTGMFVAKDTLITKIVANHTESSFTGTSQRGCDFRLTVDAGVSGITNGEMLYPDADGKDIALFDGQVKIVGTLVPANSVLELQLKDGTYSSDVGVTGNCDESNGMFFISIYGIEL
jgi:hypothetical protein